MKKIKIIFSASAVLIVIAVVLAIVVFSFDQAKARSIIFGSHINRNDLYNDRIIVKFKAGAAAEKIQKIKSASGVKDLKEISLGLSEMEISDKTAEEAISELEKNPEVEYAEPNYVIEAQMVPNDFYYNPYQWNFKNIGMEQSWDKANGNGVVVAVLDTGVAYEDYKRDYKIAPDLAGTNFVAGYDFVNNDTHPNDDNGHGTHLAGTIAQTTNNNQGAAGIAYQSSIMPIKILDKRGRGSYTDLAEALVWAADHGAKIVNLSLGGSYPATYLEEALAYTYNKGVTIVAASGNSGKNAVLYPAAYDNYVIAVGATRYDETRSSYSNYGASLDLVAPGGDLRVDQNKDRYGDGILQQTFQTNRPTKFGYYFYQGTSMAAAHVSGVAALLYGLGAITPSQVKNILQSTAKDKGAIGWDQYYGYGLIDAAGAINYLNP